MIIFILEIVLIFTVLIGVHEVGHLIAAKAARVGVEKFSIGFGPALVKVKLGGTIYQLSLIPIGGYVKMEGEDFTDAGFFALPAGRKIGVTLAGPLANVVLAFLVSLGVVLGFGEPYTKPVLLVEPGLRAARAGVQDFDRVLTVNGRPIPSFTDFDQALADNLGRPVDLVLDRHGGRATARFDVQADSLGIRAYVPAIVGRVKESSPARRLGLAPGDRILAVNDIPVRDWEEMVGTVRGLPGKPVRIEWQHGSQVRRGTVTAASTPDETGKPVGQIGIVVRTDRRPVGLLRAIDEAARETWRVTRQTFEIIGKLITCRISRRAVGGPVLIAQLTVESARWGLEYYLFLLVLLSINLFAINLFPIPALDGGRVLMFLLETVFRRRFTNKEWSIALQVGYGLVILLAIFVTFNDITRILTR